MKRLPPLFRLSLILGLLLVVADAPANQANKPPSGESHWYVHGGGYVHIDDRDDYEGPPLFGGIEYHRPDNWFGGLSLFNN